MIIVCDFCGKTLEKLGALLFGPPINKRVEKFHLCIDCYDIIIERKRESNADTEWTQEDWDAHIKSLVNEEMSEKDKKDLEEYVKAMKVYKSYEG